MVLIFVDSSFYIALLYARDRYHDRARELQHELARRSDLRFMTTEAVLVEVLTRLSKYGPHFRRVVADFVSGLRDDPRLTIEPQTHEMFESGLEMFTRRPDKSYSMTDCMSMVVCRERGITDVLTADHDFEQEGFTILLTRQR
ncbi:MAG: type II toxin-antitoxin system VapC family toxin [Chloroflexi bacterium]|nr:type II toxin-antitoxin system VapC family toxin [Chloroflexota bacterium]